MCLIEFSCFIEKLQIFHIETACQMSIKGSKICRFVNVFKKFLEL